jgi:hypothetical protein
VAPERNEATLLLDQVYCAVAPKAAIGDVRTVTPNISQELVRVLVLSRLTFPCPHRSVVYGRLQDVNVRKVRMIVTDAGHDLGKCGHRIWHPHTCDLRRFLQSK